MGSEEGRIDEYQPNDWPRRVGHWHARHLLSRGVVKLARSSQVSAGPRRGLGPAVKRAFRVIIMKFSYALGGVSECPGEKTQTRTISHKPVTSRARSWHAEGRQCHKPHVTGVPTHPAACSVLKPRPGSSNIHKRCDSGARGARLLPACLPASLPACQLARLARWALIPLEDWPETSSDLSGGSLRRSAGG